MAVGHLTEIGLTTPHVPRAAEVVICRNAAHDRAPVPYPRTEVGIVTVGVHKLGGSRATEIPVKVTTAT